MKTIAVFLRPGSQWNPDLPVREQAYWDEHARFVDALFAAGTVILAGPFADGSGVDGDREGREHRGGAGDLSRGSVGAA